MTHGNALTADGRPYCRCDAYGLAGCPECQGIAERRAKAELRQALTREIVISPKSEQLRFPLDQRKERE